jgi:recombination protein RecA
MGNLDDVFKKMDKTYGAGLTKKGSDVRVVERLPTGIFPLDLSLGGGFPINKISEIYGPNSSGKTNIALKCIAMHQKIYPHLRCLFIDAEHSFDKVWAALLGVNVETLDVYTPPYAEQTADVLEQCLLAEDMGLVILDSVAALATTAEIEKSAEGFLMGGPAILMGRLIKKALVSMSKSAGEGRYPTLICINQTRMKIGTMFGDPETTPGGNALPFYAGMRLRTYGKNIMENTVSSAMPAFKQTDTVVKKWKVPITSVNSTFKIATIAHKGLNIGDADDWNTLATYAKNYGLLMKAEKGSGWLLGETAYPTLQAIRDALYSDVSLGNTMRNYIIEMALADTELPPESEGTGGSKGKVKPE